MCASKNIVDSVCDLEEFTDADSKKFDIRPRAMQDFIGQMQVKNNLKVFINAAKRRNEAMDHALLSGPPGLGKTTLASIIANELSATLKTTSGPAIVKAADLAAILTNLQPYNVLFIDEIHRLSKTVEEILYSAMEDKRLDIVIGEGPAARTLSIDISPFTLIGATTRPGSISKPLRDRFGISLSLEFYTHEELKEMIIRSSKAIGSVITNDAAHEISLRSRSTPRVAITLLKRVRDFCDVCNKGIIERCATIDALDKLGVDSLGLNKTDHTYITHLINVNRAVGLNSIAAFMSESPENIEQIVEPYLIRIGFIARTPKGRICTDLATQHYKNNMKIKYQPDLDKTHTE